MPIFQMDKLNEKQKVETVHFIIPPKFPKFHSALETISPHLALPDF